MHPNPESTLLTKFENNKIKEISYTYHQCALEMCTHSLNYPSGLVRMQGDYTQYFVQGTSKKKKKKTASKTQERNFLAKISQNPS